MTEQDNNSENKKPDSDKLSITDEEIKKKEERLKKRREYNKRYYANKKGTVKNTSETVDTKTALKNTDVKNISENKKDTKQKVSSLKIILAVIGLVISTFLIFMFIGKSHTNTSSSSSSNNAVGFEIKRE